MNMKKIIMSGLLFLGVLSASAQAEQKGTTEYVFNPHWYIQLQPVGGQYTLGEVDFSDLFSYNVQGAIGYNFTKVVGARLAVNAWQSKAGIKVDNFKQNWKWTYVAPSLDLTFNLSNLICGFNPNRFFNLTAFVGGGANFASGNDDAVKAKNNLKAYMNASPYLIWNDADQNMDYVWDGSKTRFFGQAGLIADFRLTDAISLNVEVNANTLSDKYNSKRARNADWYFNALAGVKVNLGKTYSTKFIPAPEPEIRYVEKVVEKVVEVPAKVEAAPAIEPIRRDVFFKINSYKIAKNEEQKVKDIVDYMQKYPNSKVVITGYADAGTGNDRINDRLAAQRADAVVKALKTQYGISADRITYDSKGARVQPFAENDKNRVSICIAE
ncbi:MAG: OmpA family protein [Prevotella sp.]|nr:OmpA family protein [Prevotella sp.]